MANISEMRGTYIVKTIDGRKLSKEELSELRDRINRELDKFNELTESVTYNTYFYLENNIPKNDDSILLEGEIKGDGRWTYSNNIGFFTNEDTETGKTLKKLDLSGIVIDIDYEDCEISDEVFSRGIFSLSFKEPFSLPEEVSSEKSLIWNKETFRNSIYFNDERDIEWSFYSDMYPLQSDWERMDEEEQLRVTFMELHRHNKILDEKLQGVKYPDPSDYAEYISDKNNVEFLRRNIKLGREYYIVDQLENELTKHKRTLEELLRVPLK